MSEYWWMIVAVFIVLAVLGLVLAGV